MSLPAGDYELGPAGGHLLVRTAPAGVAAAMGHHLVLEARRWSARLVIDDAGSTTLTADVAAHSLGVREGSGGAKPLTDRDRADIAKNITQVLRSDRHPQITFVSTSVEPGGDDRLAVAGDLTITGAQRPVRFDIVLAQAGDGIALRTSVELVQSEWGIRPFTALMGTLKVADRVVVEAEATIR